MALQLDFAIIDVFTQKKYEGNPLAIVRVPRACTLSQEQKQTIAREFNLSETTFLHEKDAATGLEWTVDIFTVYSELPFAGHPTIGTACFVLSDMAKECGDQSKVEASFNIKAGRVQLEYDVEARTAKAEIPHNVHVHQRSFSQDELLSVQPQLVKVNLKDSFPIVSIVKGMTFVLVELESLEAMKHVTMTGFGPDPTGLDEGWSQTFVGTYFFVRTGKDAEHISLRTRMISQRIEDPATGSAASDLAAYLSLVEGKPGQSLKYAITQGVEMGRRSEIKIEVVLKSESGIDKIVLEGGAVRVMEGRLNV